MSSKITIALAGSPNSGKTTLFNALTGARQRVANYPGTTVETKEGLVRRDGTEILFVDLPGTYSLSAYSQEEIVARDYLIRRKPDAVIAVVDASNLERNLYVPAQLIELGVPLVLAFNMMDIVRRQGSQIDIGRLSMLLGVPIVPTVGTRGEGVGALLDAALSVAERKVSSTPAPIRYGGELEEEIAKVAAVIGPNGSLVGLSPRWVAARLLENDAEIASEVRKSLPSAGEVFAQVAKSASHLRTVLGGDVEDMFSDRRYGFISGACQESVIATPEFRHVTSDKIDAVVTSPLFGIPILLLLMYGVFYAAFHAASVPGQWLSLGLGWLSGVAGRLLPADPLTPLSLRSLVIDGVIGGVGSVLVFLPNMMVLFLAIALLEDSGYMARAAFVMDNLMHKMGLHGKSFIPMVIGFGCSVPAIMSTRIIENRLGRLTTMLIIPLVSCGARLPVYSLIIPAFFAPRWRAGILWAVYVLGILLAIIAARVLRATLFRGESHPFVMELPPYRLPTLKGIFIHMWEKSNMYLRKAGTIILAVSILIWFAAHWPSPPAGVLASRAPAEAHSLVLADSLVGRFGRAVEPVLRPLGFDWRIGSALVGASAAKEVFVAQMGIIFGVGESADSASILRQRLGETYSVATALSMLVYLLVASPCVVTCAITRRESGSWKWAALQWGGLTLLGYVVALITYQLARLAGLGG